MQLKVQSIKKSKECIAGRAYTFYIQDCDTKSLRQKRSGAETIVFFMNSPRGAPQISTNHRLGLTVHLREELLCARIKQWVENIDSRTESYGLVW